MTARTERCCCGGQITADPEREGSLVMAIGAHNATQQHQRWRREREEIVTILQAPERLSRAMLDELVPWARDDAA